MTTGLYVVPDEVWYIFPTKISSLLSVQINESPAPAAKSAAQERYWAIAALSTGRLQAHPETYYAERIVEAIVHAEIFRSSSREP